ncbi:HipA N-terminal domain-containing protein [Limnobacter sp.]|uniref:HipA N-terminal domain-containing protein n=1 Tax=Limnobacter sp. TaxID=2003368 RepID=UPI002FE3CC16
MAGSEHPTLGLYIGQQHVATVHFEYTRIHRFEYTPQWQQEGFALSPNMPLNNFNCLRSSKHLIWMNWQNA